MNAEILAVGTELLMGQIANTNAQYISGRLPDVGVGVYYHSVVGDNPERLKAALALALSRADIVITTGGLGPTQDDLTKETIASMMGRSLVLDQKSLEKIEDFFKRIKRPMADNNRKQALLPDRSIIMRNNNGTAPGCIIEEGNKVVMMLPGPPAEMKPMFEEYIIPFFEKRLEYKLVSKYVKTFGVGESNVENILIDIIDNQTNPTLATYAKDGEVTIRVTAKCSKDDDGTELIKPVLDVINERLGTAVYSCENKSMEETVGQILISKGVTISVAESCTGGLLGSRLTDISGISSVFKEGIITYSNESKVENLKVKEETLKAFGAVSRETATEMALGIRAKTGTDIGVAITGIAGPDGGTEEKPVGLVYVALANESNTVVRELKLWGNRSRIRNMSVLNALDMIRLSLI